MGEPVHEWLICPFEVGMQMLKPHSAPARTIKQPADALNSLSKRSVLMEK
jgi:hypothetical protein